jgi:hypothetical protein
MARIIKLSVNNETLFVNIDTVKTIKITDTDPVDKNKHKYRFCFVDGSYLENITISDALVEELHLG